MKFIFHGSLAEFMELLPIHAETRYKEFPFSYANGVLEIGFLRLGRKKGRYFVANVTDRGDSVLLDGEITNKSSPFPRKTLQMQLREISSAVLGFLLFYITLGALPWALWWALDIPHVWLAFVLPALPIIPFLFPCKETRNYDYEDEAFCLFLETLCGIDHPVPNDTKELYEMLLNTQNLHSLPTLNNDELVWELYDKVTVEASIIKNSTIIELLGNNFFRTAYTHWHPNPEEMYGELRELGKKGHILVLRKTLLGTETYYYGDPNGYTLPKKKKWHWGRLIYLEQR